MIRPRPTPRLLTLLIAGLTVLAWWRRFVQDDAFITFRYAANLAQGHGLVYNPGQPPVEGYTNFLWAVLMAGPLGMGWDPVVASQILGVACFAAMLTATARLAAVVGGDRAAVLPAVVLVGTNHSVLSWATGGMATMLQTALLTMAAVLAVSPAASGRHGIRRLAVLSSLVGLAGLTRPDSALPGAVMILFVAATLLRRPGSGGDRLRSLAALVLPAALMLAPYAAWKLSFYGSLLPNTFHAKAGQLTSMRTGLRYLLEFLLAYGWLPVIVLAAGAARGRVLRGGIMLTAVVLAWSAYLVKVGGGFMEFRLLVPMLPLAGVLLAVSLGAPAVVRWRPYLLAGLVAVSVLHGQIFAFRAGIESVNDLTAHMTESRWDLVGQTLGRHFGGLEEPVVMATTAAGAVPFYSGLKTVDMLGLNDAGIARDGAVLSRHPGHKRVARAQQILDRGVHLVVGHPQVQGRDAPVPVFTVDNAGFAMAGLTEELLPSGARVVAVPLDRDHVVLVLLFLPHAGVDGVVAAEGWRTWPVRRGG